MNRSVRSIIVFTTVAAFVVALMTTSAAQRKKDDFSHSTLAHKKIDCSSCHKTPTPNWVSARKYPDVADFPGHASCISCHRRDFFGGNRPAICAGCHTNPGPRGAARFAFPVRTRSTEFQTVFPHDVHQNLIAKGHGDNATGHFINASYTNAVADDPPEFNNCSLCHKTADKLPKFAPRTLTGQQPLAEAIADSFAPTAGFFKENPSSHASCFNCHFQGVKPDRNNCAGCHSLTAAYFETSTKSRYSIKFDHLYKDHVNKDCTTCHVRITQNSDVRKMVDADVPFMSCSTSSCHGKHIDEEMTKRADSIAAKQPVFQCNYCHAPAIGRYPIPESHKNR